MIGIIAAMDEEVNEIIKLLENPNEVKDETNDESYVRGLLSSKEVVIKKSGIGKAQAAISTTLMINSFHPEYIVNIGSAGSLKENVKIGDVVLGSKIAYWDVNVFGWDRSFEADHMSIVCHADKELLEVAKTLTGVNIHVGPIVSGDSFVTKVLAEREILPNFSEALCAEMEAGAIAFTCRRLNTPCIIIRGISDQTLLEGNNLTFEEYLKTASKVSAQLCKEFVGKK